MSLFGDKKGKTWQNLTFGRQQTKAGQLAREQVRSHRVTRVGTTLVFAVGVSVLIAFRPGFVPRETPQITLGPFGDLQGCLWVLGAVLLAHTVMFLLVRAYHLEVVASVRRFSQFFVLVAMFLLVAKALHLWGDVTPFFIPLPVLAVPLALIYGGRLAIHASFMVSILLGIMVGVSPDTSNMGVWHEESLLCVAVAASQFFGAVIAVLGSARIRNRTKIFTVGVVSGFGMFMAIVAFQLWLIEDVVRLGKLPELWKFFIAPLGGALNGLVSGVVITSALPFLERIFEVTTDMRLVELADQNRPLLRTFSLVAPGSFQHSLMVGQLAEEAAQSIGANDLLARVGALYHDIGKMMKPNYFVENMDEGDNVHDRLSPEMSRLIIVSHVKDGIRIAQEEGLPKPIIDMIPMHHGTSVVEYFYRKKRQQEEEDGRSESGQEAFQYPGPRPTFREAGILMLADTTEAISRVQSDPTPARLRALVREVIQKKMATNQLDECELTMHDLSRIEDAFVRVLAAIHHGRVRYPTDEEQGGGRTNGKGKDDRGGNGGRANGKGNGHKGNKVEGGKDAEPETETGEGSEGEGNGAEQRDRVATTVEEGNHRRTPRASD